MSTSLSVPTVVGRRDRARPWRPSSRGTATSAVIIVTAFLVLVPFAYLLWVTFVRDGRLTFDAFSRAYEGMDDLRMLRNSIVFALGTTTVSVTVGASLGFLVIRTNMPLKRPVFIGLIGSLIMPGVLYATAWVLLASPRSGALGALLEPIVGPEKVNVFTLGGMVLVSGLFMSPIVLLLFAAAFRSLDPSLEESALVSGASQWMVLRRVTMPLMKPTTMAAVLLMFIIGLQTFEVPSIIGRPGGIMLFTARIREVLSTYPPDYDIAGAFALSMLAIIIASVVIQSRLTRSSRRFQTVTGKAFRPREIDLGRWRWPIALSAFVVMSFAFLIPMLIVLNASFQPFVRVPSIDAFSVANLDAYRKVLDSPLVKRAAFNSLFTSVVAATIVMLLMAIAAWIVVRSRVRARWMVEGLATLPLLIPGIVLGLALLIFYLRVPVPIYGTLWVLVIAYCTQYLPFGMRYASSSMYQIASELEEAAAVSGATWFQTMRRVFLPLLAPGLAAGWVFILVISTRDLSTIVLLYGPGTEVIPVVMFQNVFDNRVPEAAALGVMLVVVLLTLTTIALAIARRFGVRLL